VRCVFGVPFGSSFAKGETMETIGSITVNEVLFLFFGLQAWFGIRKWYWNRRAEIRAERQYERELAQKAEETRRNRAEYLRGVLGYVEPLTGEQAVRAKMADAVLGRS
jgi:hypothetical protein